jgi:hypothetical protein
MNPQSPEYDYTDPFGAVNARNNPPTELFPFVKIRSEDGAVDMNEGVLKQWVTSDLTRGLVILLQSVLHIVGKMVIQ